MAYENNDKKIESVYSKRMKAGKRRTYFFDVRETRGNDFFLTITESRKRFDTDGYDRHKIFLYKEDFNKFIKGLNEAVDYVKTELMPDFDFDAFNHDNPEGEEAPIPAFNSPVPPTMSDIIKPAPEAHNESTQDEAGPGTSGSNADDNTNPDSGLNSEEVDKW